MRTCKQTPAVITTTIISVCPKCGTIGKSGKSSCCGRGGSWYKNCGNDGKSNVDHTWYEGIQTCKTLLQVKAVIAKQQHAVHQLNPREILVITTSKTFTFRSANMSTPMSDTISIISSVKAPVNSIITTSTISTSTNLSKNCLWFCLCECIFLVIFKLIQCG